MDDLQFRRNIYADPKHIDNETQKALNDDPTKQKFVDDMLAFDKKIAKALNVEVPENLCHSIILNQTLGLHAKQKRKSRIHLALAASIAFTFGIAVTAYQSSYAFADIGEQAIAHVYHEENAFSNNATTRVSLTTLNDKMHQLSGSFINEIGHLIAADYCRFGGNQSLHLVFQGKEDIITVFIMPNDEALSFKPAFADNKLHGIAQQYGQHNVVIIGDKTESLDNWQQSINSSIQWSI